MKPKQPKLFLYLLGGVLLINLIQGHFTELLFDEAYYWHYAGEMAWGYFDHPPMVALLIKLGSSVFPGELGVRLMSCFLSVGTIWFLWLMIETPKKRRFVLHFYVLVFSMTLLNAYGFFTLPDTPLIFFTVLFLWLYKRFLHNGSWALALALGVVMAALMYSKYHAVLVILFVLLSNLSLLKNKFAWGAVITALVCYVPHFFWLAENDFVSIRYHLFERPNQGYEFAEFTGGYLLNLIALFGFTFPWIYWALLKTKAEDRFTKALFYLTFGVILFFFLSSFQRRVQTQWIILICIPLAVIVFRSMMEDIRIRKWIFRSGIANIFILLFLRLGLVYPSLFPIVFETHGNEKWVQDIVSQIGDIPVVFENSYREASMYSFYSGNPAFSLNNIYYRKNQYSIDRSESVVQHKKVLKISKYLREGDISYETPKGQRYYGIFVENFESFRKLDCEITSGEVSPGGGSMTLAVYNPYPEAVDLSKLKFGLAYLNRYKRVQEVIEFSVAPIKEGISALSPGETTCFKFTMPPPVQTKEPEYFKACISENELIWGLNGQTNALN